MAMVTNHGRDGILDICINFDTGKCTAKMAHCPWFKKGECIVSGECGHPDTYMNSNKKGNQGGLIWKRGL